MDINIEKSLLKHKTHIIDYATLTSILVNNGYIGINDKINKLKQKGILQTLKKGLYLHKSPFIQNQISKEIIANTLLSPSYISFDYALYYYNLIPENVYDITSATTKRSKIFATKNGNFNFKHIKKELFSIGLVIQKTQNGNFLMASKEKALCDKIYYIKNIKTTSKKAMVSLLIDDLRIDIDELNNIDIAIFQNYFKITKSKKIKLLIEVLKNTI